MSTQNRNLRVTAALAAAFALAACGAPAPAANGSAPAAQSTSSSANRGTPAASSGSQGPRSDAQKLAAYNAVCALFTRDEALAVVGDNVQLAASPPPLGSVSAGAVPAIGDAAACEYWTVPPVIPGAPPEAAQGIQGFPAIYVAVDTKLVGWQLIQGNDKKETLSGLGDEAYYVPSQLTGDTAGGYLAARKGAKYLFITRTMIDSELPDVKARLITLAQSILAKV